MRALQMLRKMTIKLLFYLSSFYSIGWWGLFNLVLCPSAPAKVWFRSCRGPHLHSPNILCQILQSPSAPQQHNCHPLWCSGTAAHQSAALPHTHHRKQPLLPQKASFPTTRVILLSTQIIKCSLSEITMTITWIKNARNIISGCPYTHIEFSAVVQVRSPQVLGLSCWTPTPLGLQTRGTHHSWCYNHKCPSADTQNILHLFEKNRAVGQALY